MENRYFERQYAKGYAVGQAIIHEDTVEFRHRDEFFSFPCIKVMDMVKSDGTYYLVKVKRLRKLAKEKK